MSKPTPFAFISYRRTDSSAAARWLASTIARTFGAEAVFIDTESIRVSDNWAEQINQALAEATLVIPVIGATWLSTHDEDHRRRIDKPDDWVHKELAHALTTKLRVLPVVLSGAQLPKASALPPELSTLPNYQAFELRDAHWEKDLAELLAQMETFGFRRLSTETLRYPKPMVNLTELTEAELDTALEQLPKWRIIASPLPKAPSRQRYELYRAFEFDSFREAMEFMAKATPWIDQFDHHPRWENLWRTVSVWLSTWDIGHKPSILDLQLAQQLDALRKELAPKI